MTLSTGVSLSRIMIEAPTRFRIVAGQVSGRHFKFVSAPTAAQPVADSGAVLMSRRSLLNRGKPAECLSGQVFSVVSTSSHLARVPENWRWSQ